ncbi:FAD-binding protein [Patescibacteria group bacterium]|nr:FAD-binding protein [Patescibacteria group bacterium]
MKIQQNILLSNFCTFKTGGCAKYFVAVKNIDELKQAVDFAEQNQLPVFVLGGGSNLLISDEGVNGLVIKMEMKGIEFNPSLRARHHFLNSQKAKLFANLKSGVGRRNPAMSETIQVTAFAGEIWDDFVEKCVEKNLYGLENLSGVPGTVGASAIQNIGAYGVEAKEVIDWVEVFDIETGETKKLKKNECQFGYRDSIFKKTEGKNLIVIRVVYKLQNFQQGVTQLKTDYKDIQEWVSTHSSLRDFLEPDFSTAQRVEPLKSLAQENRGNPASFLTPKQLREIIIQIRKNKLPDLKQFGTAGSFFKNPVITKKQLEKILQQYPNLPYFPHNQKKWAPDTHISNPQLFKISLAFILDKILGLKGFKEGETGVFEKHSLIIVNHGNATSTEIKNLAQKITKDIKQKTGLDIDNEVVLW